MNRYLLRRLRSRFFQRIWERLHRTSLIGMNFWASDLFETGEIDALNRLKLRMAGIEQPVIFDVGANVGNYTGLCLQLLGPRCIIHAFEPSAATFEELNRRVGHEEQVHTHHLGLSDRARGGALYSPADGSTLASLHALDPLDQPPKRCAEKVRLTTIDTFCLDAGIDWIDFLKLDIEGHEYHALLGAKRMLDQGRIRFLQFEFGENNIGSRTYLRDFAELLESRYKISRVVSGGLVPWTYRGGASEIFATMNYFCELRDDRAALGR